MSEPRLLDQVRDALRVRHYSLRTEEAYLHWIRRFILFHGERHPCEMGRGGENRGLPDLPRCEEGCRSIHPKSSAASSAPVTGVEASVFMNSKTKYSNEPLGKVAVVEDFLPPPERLAFREETVKVTITLNKASIEFFKREAKRHGTPYQAMIRRLLDAYAQRYAVSPDSGGGPRRGK